MVKKFFQTNDDVALLILRVGLGVVFFPHGMQKLFGWFGGYGFSASMGWFTNTLHVSAFLAFLAIITEGLGSLGLITGFLTRLVAFGLAVEMAVAVYLLHWQNGFFMNWAGKQAGEGYEYHILVIAMAIMLMIRGGGKWSVDQGIARTMQ